MDLAWLPVTAAAYSDQAAAICSSGSRASTSKIWASMLMVEKVKSKKKSCANKFTIHVMTSPYNLSPCNLCILWAKQIYDLRRTSEQLSRTIRFKATSSGAR